MRDKSYEFAKLSAELACEVKNEYFEKTGKKIWVAGSIGPTSKSASIPTGDIPYERQISFDELKEAYSEQIQGLIDGGVDILLIETIFDGINAKSAVVACEEVFEKIGKTFPVMVSATVNKQGKLLSGQSIESLVVSLDRDFIISFGLNCSFGAKDLIPLIKKLGKFTDKYISLYPNAGLPNENGEYDETPEKMSEDLKELVEENCINILGGCCGTHFAHISAISKLVKDKKPRVAKVSNKKPYFISGNDIYNFENRFSVIGERNNVAGSKIFKNLIEQKNYVKALEIARSQIKNGANIIDINMDDGLLNSSKEMEKYLRVIQNDPLVSKSPIMIDSSDFKTIETALKNISGKPIVNSISLKEGEEKFIEKAKIIKKYGIMIDSSDFKTIETALKNISGKPIVNSISLKEGEEKFIEKAKIIKKYGAIVVVMAFDEQGQGVSFERKIEIWNSISLKEGEEKFIEKAKIIKKYGAIVVVMAFDEQGQGVSFERKIEICNRSYKILKDLGFKNWEIIFDPNILTIGTGSENDKYNGINYLKACKWIKENLKCGVVGGLSNLSFAFRGNNPLRASIHSIFLDEGKTLGMNFAIMNPGEKSPELSSKDKQIIKNLIDGKENSLDEILSLSIKKSETTIKKSQSNTVEDKIQEALIFGGSTTFYI